MLKYTITITVLSKLTLKSESLKGLEDIILKFNLVPGKQSVCTNPDINF